jgi:Phage capsid family
VPPPTTTAVWGQESWSNVLIEALQAEAVLLASGASRVVAEGRIVHVPRLLVDPDADWVAELAELPSNAGDADTLDLTPKKIGNVFNLSTESIEDSPVGQLDAIGRAMVRGVARKVDAKFFSNAAATATAPAGLLSYTLPASTATAPDIAGLLTAQGEIEAEGGVASAAFLNAADKTAVQIAAINGGYATSDPSAPGITRVGASALYTAPGIAAGSAVVCDPRYIAVAIRRDASAEFSEHAAWTKDGVSARVTMRVDWAPSDPSAFRLIT